MADLLAAGVGLLLREGTERVAVLRGNLATRPFYNERLVRVSCWPRRWPSAAAWAAVNVANVVSLSQQGAMLADRVRSEGLAADGGADRRRGAARHAEPGRDRRGVAARPPRPISSSPSGRSPGRRCSTASRRRCRPTCGWSQVQPQTDDDGQLMVSLTVVSRRIEDLDAFIDRLEATGAFRGVLSRADNALEDGTIESNLQGYYVQAANPAPAASDPQERRSPHAASRPADDCRHARALARRVLAEHRSGSGRWACSSAANLSCWLLAVLPMSRSVLRRRGSRPSGEHRGQRRRSRAQGGDGHP